MSRYKKASAAVDKMAGKLAELEDRPTTTSYAVLVLASVTLVHAQLLANVDESLRGIVFQLERLADK